MFTGIIETLGTIIDIQKEKSNITFTIKSSISDELRVDQSLAHDGVCLTVVKVANNMHKVTAIDETLQKSNLNKWEINSKINLERCTKINERLDGHIVQGHIDCVAICEKIEDVSGSWKFTFKANEASKKLIVEKGSISINGVSLTVVNSTGNLFSVAIIPYTYKNTSFCNIEKGSLVNIEYDIIGKYVLKILGES
jgi:riboflavin synthase